MHTRPKRKSKKRYMLQHNPTIFQNFNCKEVNKSFQIVNQDTCKGGRITWTIKMLRINRARSPIFQRKTILNLKSNYSHFQIHKNLNSLLQKSLFLKKLLVKDSHETQETRSCEIKEKMEKKSIENEFYEKSYNNSLLKKTKTN